MNKPDDDDSWTTAPHGCAYALLAGGGVCFVVIPIVGIIGDFQTLVAMPFILIVSLLCFGGAVGPFLAFRKQQNSYRDSVIELRGKAAALQEELQSLKDDWGRLHVIEFTSVQPVFVCPPESQLHGTDVSATNGIRLILEFKNNCTRGLLYAIEKVALIIGSDEYVAGPFPPCHIAASSKKEFLTHVVAHPSIDPEDVNHVQLKYVMTYDTVPPIRKRRKESLIDVNIQPVSSETPPIFLVVNESDDYVISDDSPTQTVSVTH